jgi:hypothetical protein
MLAREKPGRAPGGIFEQSRPAWQSFDLFSIILKSALA